MDASTDTLKHRPRTIAADLVEASLHELKLVQSVLIDLDDEPTLGSRLYKDISERIVAIKEILAKYPNLK